MIKFRCKNCNQRIVVPQIYAGKKGKCPKCKGIVVVPWPNQDPMHTDSSSSYGGPVSSKGLDFNSAFQDLPRTDTIPPPPTAQDEVSDKDAEQLRKLEEQVGVGWPEPVSERKLPWLLDILLYPTSTHGLTILAIIVGIPLLISLVAILLGPFGFFVAIPGFFINVVVGLYMYWYFCNCIRDSAEGNLRAPDVLVNAPGLGEMFGQFFRIIGCLSLFAGPAGIYFIKTTNADGIFWLLVAGGSLFFPMGLLAVITFDSFSALNPLLIIASIFSTFLQYLGLLIVSGIIVGIFVILSFVLSQFILGMFVFRVAFVYLLMVYAHILGRFYWRYKGKLRWEV